MKMTEFKNCSVIKKRKVILDITPLQNGYFQDASRSGIFFVVRNILLELLLRDDIELFFNVTRLTVDSRMKVNTVLAKEFPESVSFINSRICSIETPLTRFLDCHLQRIAMTREKFSDCKSILFLLRSYNFFFRLFGKFLSWCFVKETLCGCHEDAFFISLMLRVPEYVKEVIAAERCYTVLHDAIPLRFPEIYVKERQCGWFYDLIQHLSAEENYFAISDSTQKDYKRLFPDLAGKNMTVVHWAAADIFQPVADVEKKRVTRLKYHIPADKRIFLSHCSMAPHKNLQRLFEAFCKIQPKYPDWIIVFSGSNIKDQREKLLQIARKNNLPESAFVFTGYVADDDLPVLYSLADVFCFISLCEGFGLPVLEAMQCGCPCLISNCSSLPEVAGDAALQIDPENIGDICRGMEELAASDEMRMILHQRGLKRAACFSWSKSCEQLLDGIYNTLK